MPPARNRAAQDDAKDAKDKTGAGVGKGRKNAANNREARAEATAAANAEASTSQAQASLAWQKEDIPTLLRYRGAYHLDTPASFTSLQHQAILSNPGIGRLSPSMIRKGAKKYQPKEALATAVRKHFNAAPVNEPDVLLQFICKVKHQDKVFRQRFPAVHPTRQPPPPEQ